MTDDDKRRKMLDRVQALLAQAASTTFEGEADSARTMAAKIMNDYQIDEAELALAGMADKPKPEVRTVYLDTWYDKIETPEVRSALWLIWNGCVGQTGCRSAPMSKIINGRHAIEVVGMNVDLDFMEMLFTSLFMECVTRMDPKVDPSKPMIENLVTLKEAGHKWEYIGHELIAIGQLKEYTRNVGVRFTKLYKDYCDRNDRHQVRTSPDVYKRSFISGFSTGVTTKLYEMQREKEAAWDGRGVGLVLRNSKTDVNALWEEMFAKEYAKLPRYTGGGGRMRSLTIDANASARGRAAGREAALAGQPTGKVGGDERANYREIGQ